MNECHAHENDTTNQIPRLGRAGIRLENDNSFTPCVVPARLKGDPNPAQANGLGIRCLGNRRALKGRDISRINARDNYAALAGREDLRALIPRPLAWAELGSPFRRTEAGLESPFRRTLTGLGSLFRRNS